MSRFPPGLLQCMAAAALFGASTPLAAPLAREMNAPTLAGLLYIGAALAVAPQNLRRLPPSSALRANGSRLAVAVVLGGAVGPVLLAAGLARTSAASASLLLNLELVFTVLLAGWFFREHIGPRVAAATVLVTGAGLLLSSWNTSPDIRLGAVLVAGACLCWALDNCATANVDRLAPSFITFIKGVIAGSANLTIGLATGAGPSASDTILAVGIGMIGYGLSITLWVTGARSLGAARGQVVFSAAPFVGVLLAWTLLAEPVTAPQVVAMFLLLAGITLVMRSDHDHAHAHEPLDHVHEHEHDDHHADHEHAAGTPGRHSHPHRHEPLRHDHAHVPDLHHRHRHSAAGARTER
ncbi:DMT family transporter [Blastococcus sp. TF02A-30]|uniref:DMT family transporter n=1 Tax=Blastococcus sp. TF02A-30 TaxID=2250580 RepID=UPI000DE91B5B|nr:DMT family transporter [Blastococcus sp. TF02A-30]RBY91277.1 EamA family transporter [Blastococcus sp. TF02A-30]